MKGENCLNVKNIKSFNQYVYTNDNPLKLSNYDLKVRQQENLIKTKQKCKQCVNKCYNQNKNCHDFFKCKNTQICYKLCLNLYCEKSHDI